MTPPLSADADANDATDAENTDAGAAPKPGQKPDAPAGLTLGGRPGPPPKKMRRMRRRRRMKRKRRRKRKRMKRRSKGKLFTGLESETEEIPSVVEASHIRKRRKRGKNLIEGCNRVSGRRGGLRPSLAFLPFFPQIPFLAHKDDSGR